MQLKRFLKRGLIAAGLLTVGVVMANDGSLLEAVRKGQLSQVQQLLEQGAALDGRGLDGSSPLLLATRDNRVDIARALIEAGADVNRKNLIQDSPYLLAGASGHNEILKLTLAHGADLKSTNRYGGTALIPACERGHVETVRLLIEAGVELDHVNHLGWTCLMEAIVLSDGGPAHQQIVAQLIAAGADLNLPDRAGLSPLQQAERRGQSAIAKLLRDAGAA
ncbi:ankyrin repeat domain-containing protein [Pseudomonas sp. PH1b]|uniref:ankyrin repeat domain-containing protein n=1 Tax=Pseudomonas sp. PH1b TaxID=1397282 RepID=UPI0005BB6BA0|nr:ankyrin repeat domain-containing protein [Pseudomonas sp. PH1b]BFD38965.1 ankyrin repeat domain-containing protein [Pseudomonas sp. FFPRI_1]